MSEDSKQPKLMGMPPQPPHGGRCVHCGEKIEAKTAREWHKKVSEPCPGCGRAW